MRDNLEKARAAAIAAVDSYNRPGSRFRTAQYIVLMNIAWTAAFHAVFYRNGTKPWHRKKSAGSGKAIRYVKVDGEPKHWELSECTRQYYGGQETPVRKNLEMLLGVRNKIEHRNLPELDPILYGECQAALLNLEEFLEKEFGSKYGMAESLAVSLQFSRLSPAAKRRSVKELAGHNVESVIEYIEKFRGNLPPTTLESNKYSFSVYLVPKVAGRQKAADTVVEFIPIDDASENERERMKRLNVLIREKHIPIVNVDKLKASEVVRRVAEQIPFVFHMACHTRAWKYYRVRPEKGSPSPHHTKAQYCVYDDVHGDYVYTNAWVERSAEDLCQEDMYMKVTGWKPKLKPSTNVDST